MLLAAGALAPGCHLSHAHAAACLAFLHVLVMILFCQFLHPSLFLCREVEGYPLCDGTIEIFVCFYLVKGAQNAL